MGARLQGGVWGSAFVRLRSFPSSRTRSHLCLQMFSPISHQHGGFCTFLPSILLAAWTQRQQHVWEKGSGGEAEDLTEVGH